MVEIPINVRRSSICWRGRRELITDVRKPERGYDVIVGGELFTDYSDHPQTCHAAKPKTQINRRRTLPASSCWWDAYRKQFTRKDFSPKNRRCGIAADGDGAFTYD